MTRLSVHGQEVVGKTFADGTWYVAYPDCKKVMPEMLRTRDMVHGPQATVVGRPLRGDEYTLELMRRTMPVINKLCTRLIVVCDDREQQLHERARLFVAALFPHQRAMTVVLFARSEDMLASRWRGVDVKDFVIGPDGLLRAWEEMRRQY